MERSRPKNVLCSLQIDRKTSVKRKEIAMSFDAQITFIRATDLEESTRFYRDLLELELVLDQGGCRIFRAGDSAYLGVCVHMGEPVPEGVVVTLVAEDVDGWHERLIARGVEFDKEPTHNAQFKIYHCFFRDPDHHLLEIQRFDDPHWNEEYCAGSESR
jgi:catechol 2,3-dioxygenase-like lactoylglutathione lyase family enzyme